MKSFIMALLVPLVIYADSYSFGYSTGSLTGGTFEGIAMRYNNTIDYISDSADGWYDATADFFEDIATCTSDGINNLTDGISDGYYSTYY